MSETSLTIQKEFPATPDVVFDAWTNPESMAQWFSPMTTASIPKLDLRVGGEYQIDMHGPDRDYVHIGKYLKVNRPSELQFTWISDGTGQKETIVTLTFEAKNAGTLLTLVHEKLESKEALDNHNGGWTAIVSKLDGVLAKTVST